MEFLKPYNLSKTLIPKPLQSPTIVITPISLSRCRLTPLHSKSHLHYSSTAAAALESSSKHTDFLVESYHLHQRLNSLIKKVSKKGSNALQIYIDDKDWSNEQFWAVVRLLLQESRSAEILPVFHRWKNMDSSRINDFNYIKIIKLFCEKGLIEQAITLLQQMREHSLSPSLEIYKPIIHWLAHKGKFDDASFFLNQIKETNLRPDSETYDGLIKAYGKYRMFDEIGLIVKKMEMEKCVSDHITINLLIREFSNAGLLQRMENTYQSLLSKRMPLQPSTLVAVLEAYANFRVLDKMEKIYKKVLKYQIPIDEALIRKLAIIYIENNMFSRLDDLRRDLFSATTESELAWCLGLLSHACLSSKRGLDLAISRMEEVGVPWSITYANMILFAYFKMNDFRRLKMLLLELSNQRAKPDLVTLGILIDLEGKVFTGIGAVSLWGKMGLLDEIVEMRTDPLVLLAFGKGRFLRSCEEMYTFVESGGGQIKVWTYRALIDMVHKQEKRKSCKGHDHS